MIRILNGDCRAVLAGLPDNSVHCCVTSPPYYGLRAYLPKGHPDKHLEIGSEDTPEAFIATMVEVFRQVRRVLRNDGTCWVNLGDSYATGTTAQRNATTTEGPDVPSSWAGRSQPERVGTPAGYKTKDLMMIPARVAIALQADGWWLRSDIIWAKRNCMPESVTDRPSSAHEHIFLLTKSERYFYDAEAIKEEGTIPAGTRAAKGSNVRSDLKDVNGRPPEYWEYTGTRNARNVWSMATKPFPEAHFATFPPELPERCMQAGTSERGCCPKCGAPWERTTKRSEMPRDLSRPQAARAVALYESGGLTPEHLIAIRACGVTDTGKALVTQSGAGKNDEGMQRLAAEAKAVLGGYHREFLLTGEVTTGWQPTCTCPTADPVPCTVLDPFGGSGTVGLVADRLGRDAILIDLNGEYREMAARRIRKDAGLFAEVTNV